MSIKDDIADRMAARKPQSALTRAHALYAERKFERALKLFNVAAQAGIAEAEREVGRHYLTGEGVRRNAVEAARWFLRAAEKGDMAACRNLAGLYMFGMREDAAALTGALLFTQAAAAEAEDQEPDFSTALRWALPAAEAGDTDAQLMAGFIYSNPKWPQRDDAKALPWFEKAAQAGAPQGHLGLGITLLRHAAGGAPEEAIAHIRQAAEAELPAAHYYLALLYDMGVNLPADPALAAQHYGVAAKANLSNAQAKYGYMLFNGIGIKANQVEGESWLRRAGLAGDPEAAALVAEIYARGDGKLPPNYAEAATWFRTAAELGHRPSARALGLLYLTGTGVPRNPDEAAIWFRRAAEAGDETAKADLASLLLSGQTSPKLTEPAPVHEWFEQAAEAGDLIAAFNYAVCLAQGVGMERDEVRAAKWMRRAAESVLNAQYWYGIMLAQGLGVDANPEEARVWLQKCADVELPDGLIALADMCLTGAGGPRDHEAGRQLYERAANRGDARGMFALGAMYGGGHDIPTDRALSLACYRAAAGRGHPLACLMLGRYLARGIATEVDLDAARHWFTEALNGGIAEARGDLDALTPPASEAAQEASAEVEAEVEAEASATE
ncbi:tetratricopeptide repeat protein [Acidocella sp.]|uniref:tetratricopeptide repeat protein n=1 Tax=Acidocella sp. TaxID=50710 RepID=UPI0026255C2F|nr:tetratricopeptide repeat protein [Acidocella sp.]MDD2794977.1 tetratricopeptide repeat protein [Acidocella sp.]